jgi:glycerol-3-phosphate dehydrogenase (NAD(P)+)
MSVSKIAVIGAGSWGTALANMVAERGKLPEGTRVSLWARHAEQAERMRVTRENAAYLPGLRLHERVAPTHHLAEVAEAEVILMVTPSKGIREVAAQLAEMGTRAVLVSCTKGIERGTGLRMSQILHELLPQNEVAVLSGPSHAEEVAQGMPTAVVLGCADTLVATRIQHLITGKTFRVYTSTDVPGIELGGALKNIFAIAAGVGDGLGFGDNTKAALVTRALNELIRLGAAMGGQTETFRGLSGIGDLMVTCFSRHSRNRAVGERLGRGESPAQISASMQMVAEGVPTTQSAYECARRNGVETPIIDAVYGLLYEGKSPRDVLVEILSRDPRPELDERAGG